VGLIEVRDRKRQLYQLRRIIRETIELEGNSPRASGIVVVKKFDDDWKILGLRSTKPKHNGMYDLTKGLIDPGESSLEAAIRETHEESGISPDQLSFEWGKISIPCNTVTLYVASTKAEPTIRPNPNTGKIEHASADWLSIDDFKKRCIGYLRPAADWVKSILNSD